MGEWALKVTASSGREADIRPSLKDVFQAPSGKGKSNVCPRDQDRHWSRCGRAPVALACSP